jgi:hypothetical protein
MVRCFWLIGLSLAFAFAICILVLFGALNVNSIAATLTVFGFLFTRFNCQAC